MLLQVAGKSIQVVTAVTIGPSSPLLLVSPPALTRLTLVSFLPSRIVFPAISAPGYTLRSFTSSTIVKMHPFSLATAEAYVDSGDGTGKAGGFGIQGLGALLVEKVDGCYNNVSRRVCF